jgi:hypothetical protein
MQCNVQKKLIFLNEQQLQIVHNLVRSVLRNSSNYKIKLFLHYVNKSNFSSNLIDPFILWFKSSNRLKCIVRIGGAKTISSFFVI